MFINLLKLKSRLLTILFLTLLTKSFYAQLSGNYTVCSSGCDYASPTAWATALSAGVSGPVTFNISDGTYSGAVSIPNFTGGHSVTFQSTSNDSTLVIIQHTSGDIITINGQNVTLKHLTINHQGSSGSAIELGANADNNSITNCILSGCSSTGTVFTNAVIYASQTTNGNGINNFHLSQSVIIGGSYGLYFTMNSTEKPDGLLVEGCSFSDNYAGGIRTVQMTAPVVNKNSFVRSVSNNTYYGIYLDNTIGQSALTNNYIYTTGSGTIAYGINLATNSTSTSGNNALIANNSIQVYNGSSSAYGIDQASTSKFWNIYNNTIYMQGSSSSTYPYRTFTSSDETKLKNNIFVHEGTSTGSTANQTVSVSSLSGINAIDYNCYYTVNTGTPFRSNYGGNRTTFTAHTGVTGETNSLNIDPEMTFVMGIGWKAFASGLIGAGEYLSEVPEDINGVVRSNPTTIGAHENGVSSNPPTAEFSANILNPCIGQTVVFSDESLDDPSEWLWEIAGPGTAQFVNATSAASMNPQLEFPVDGIYSIQLTATNSSGSDVELKSNYITVKSAMGGSYTINSGAATSGTNYTSFTDALNDLSCRGVSSAVMYTVVVPSGPYNEQISIPAIEGASVTNTITFKGQSGNLLKDKVETLKISYYNLQVARAQLTILRFS